MPAAGTALLLLGLSGVIRLPVTETCSTVYLLFFKALLKVALLHAGLYTHAGVL
jgi:hypothetical protein